MFNNGILLNAIISWRSNVLSIRLKTAFSLSLSFQIHRNDDESRHRGNRSGKSYFSRNIVANKALIGRYFCRAAAHKYVIFLTSAI